VVGQGLDRRPGADAFRLLPGANASACVAGGGGAILTIGDLGPAHRRRWIPWDP